MNLRLPLATLLLVAFAGPPARGAEPTVLGPGTLLARAAGAGDATLRVRGLMKTGRVADAVVAAREALLDPGLDPVARERLRYDTLLALADAAPEAAARDFVAESRQAEPRFYLEIDESGHEIAVPAWDSPAAARYAERRWSENAARDRTLDVLAARGDLAGHWAGLAPVARPGALAALREASPALLEGPAAALGSDLAAGIDVAPPALVVARRTGDATLFAAALAAAPAPEAVVALRDDLGAFDAGARVDILETALGRDALASAALLRLAAEAPTQPRAEALLWSALSSPGHGASAAAALARLDLPGVEDRLRTLAGDAPDAVTARWAGLALELGRQRRAGSRP